MFLSIFLISFLLLTSFVYAQSFKDIIPLDILIDFYNIILRIFGIIPTSVDEIIEEYAIEESKMIYRGICLPFPQTYSDIDYQRLKSWNLNSVMFVYYWSYIEPYYDKSGVYDETRLQLLEQEIAKARSHGLYPFITSRVCRNPTDFKSWVYPWEKDGKYIGPTHDYVNLNLSYCHNPYTCQHYVDGLASGRDRYSNYLKYMAQRFPDVGIAVWHFPYHAQDENSDTCSEGYNRRDVFYTETLPSMYQAVRSVDNRVIALSPIDQGAEKIDGVNIITGEYVFLDRDYIDYLPVEDKNVLWECNTHDGAYGAVCRACVNGNPDEWNRNYTELDEQWKPAADFKAKYDVRLVSLESIGLVIHNCSGGSCPQCGVRPIKQSRLDWVEAMLQKQDELNMSWFYWRYEKSPYVESPQEIDGSDTPVAELITEWAITETTTTISTTSTTTTTIPTTSTTTTIAPVNCDLQCKEKGYDSGVCRLGVAGESLRVIGDKIVDENGTEIRLKAFQLWGSKMIYSSHNGNYTLEDFRRIKNWGFNAVRSTVWWSKLEPNKNEVGFYDTSWLHTYEKYIRMANDAGLYWIFTTRVTHGYVDGELPDWCTWEDNKTGPTASYVSTEEGLERYANFIEWVVQELESRDHPNLIGYWPWLFPFHRESVTQEQINFYNNTVVPRLVQAVRKHSNKLVFITPIHCKPGNFVDLTPVSDAIYGFCFYKYKGMTHGTGPITEWDYNYTYQIEYIKPAKDFKDMYNVPVSLAEFGVRGDTKSQADCLDFKLNLTEEYGMSWFYWIYSNYVGTNGFDILYNGTNHPLNTPKELILNALLKYNKTEYDLVTTGCQPGETSIGQDGCPSGQTCCCFNAAIAYKTSSPITIDGDLNEWGSALTYEVTHFARGSTENNISFKTLWDDNKLYVAFEVIDDSLISDSPELWKDDSVEVYIDGLNDKSGPYGSDDKQYIISINESIVDYGVGKTQKNFPLDIVEIGNGYIVEIAIPFSDIGITAIDNKIIGFDIGMNDDDDGESWDGQLIWYAYTSGWNDTSIFGNLLLSSESPPTTTIPSDTESPQYSGLGHYPDPVIDIESAYINVTWSDNEDLDTVIIYENSTGSWKEHVCNLETGECSGETILGASNISIVFFGLTSSLIVIFSIKIGKKIKLKSELKTIVNFITIILVIFLISMVLFPEIPRNILRMLRLAIVPMVFPPKTFTHKIPAENLDGGEVVAYYSFANDTSGNDKMTEIMTFTVEEEVTSTSTVSSTTTPSTTTTSGPDELGSTTSTTTTSTASTTTIATTTFLTTYITTTYITKKTTTTISGEIKYPAYFSIHWSIIIIIIATFGVLIWFKFFRVSKERKFEILKRKWGGK